MPPRPPSNYRPATGRGDQPLRTTAAPQTTAERDQLLENIFNPPERLCPQPAWIPNDGSIDLELQIRQTGIQLARIVPDDFKTYSLRRLTDFESTRQIETWPGVSYGPGSTVALQPGDIFVTINRNSQWLLVFLGWSQWYTLRATVTAAANLIAIDDPVDCPGLRAAACCIAGARECFSAARSQPANAQLLLTGGQIYVSMLSSYPAIKISQQLLDLVITAEHDQMIDLSTFLSVIHSTPAPHLEDGNLAAVGRIISGTFNQGDMVLNALERALTGSSTVEIDSEGGVVGSDLPTAHRTELRRITQRYRAEVRNQLREELREDLMRIEAAEAAAEAAAIAEAAEADNEAERQQLAANHRARRLVRFGGLLTPESVEEPAASKEATELSDNNENPFDLD